MVNARRQLVANTIPSARKDFLNFSVKMRIYLRAQMFWCVLQTL